MLEPFVPKVGERLEYLGPIAANPAPLGPVGQMLDSVDIWLAGTLQGLFDLIKR